MIITSTIKVAVIAFSGASSVAAMGRVLEPQGFRAGRQMAKKEHCGQSTYHGGQKKLRWTPKRPAAAGGAGFLGYGVFLHVHARRAVNAV